MRCRVRAKIRVRLTQLRPPAELEAELFGDEGWKPGDAWTAETTLGRVMFNELLPICVSVRQRADAQEGAGADRQRPGRALPDDRGRADRGQAQGRRLLLGHPLGCHRVDGRRVGAAGEAGDPGALREGSRRDREEVPAWRSQPRRAQRGAGEDLAGRHRRGRSGAAGALPGRQPDHHDRRLRCHG